MAQRLKPMALVALAALGMGLLGSCLGTGVGPDPSATAPTPAVPVTPDQLVTQWVVSPAEARFLIEQRALVLDVRDPRAQQRGRIAGSVAIRWQEFSDPTPPHQGNLLADDRALTQKLRAIGVSGSQPVVVVGDPLNGWGEDGRVVWMLHSLGHPQAVFVDGRVDSF